MNKMEKLVEAVVDGFGAEVVDQNDYKTKFMINHNGVEKFFTLSHGTIFYTVTAENSRHIVDSFADVEKVINNFILVD